MKRLHASSRRDVLLASGMLFAWPHLPKLAHAEGRDPRFLTIVLRGALDGLAAVAPIGDPDWTALRGDNALPSRARRRRSSSTISSRSIRRCRTCIACSRAARRSSSTPPPRPIGSARISTDRTCSKAVCPSPLRATAAGSIARLPASLPAAASIRRAACWGSVRPYR